VLWWAERLQEKLSQGDVVQDVAQGILVEPPTHLRFATMAKGANGWAESDVAVKRNNRFHFLAGGHQGLAVVLSYDCEIDKGQSRVTVAPLHPISSLPAEIQSQVLEQRIWALAPLPDVPGLGTFYADLRSITAAGRATVDGCQRIASMKPDAVRLLQARIIGFFTRLEF
jgi:hypothetical protein